MDNLVLLVAVGAAAVALVDAQLGLHYGAGGGHHGGYGTFGLNQGGAGGAFGGASQGGVANTASGYHGLGRGAVHQGTHGHIVGGTVVGGHGDVNGVQKNFGHQGAVRDNFNNGHNRVFAKEKVYSVDQAYGNGAKSSYGGTHGHFGGFGQGGSYISNDHLNKAHAGGYGAYNGYGNGGYRNYLNRGFGSHGYGQQAGHNVNNFGSYGGGGSNGYQTQQHIGPVVAPYVGAYGPIGVAGGLAAHPSAYLVRAGYHQYPAVAAQGPAAAAVAATAGVGPTPYY